HRPPEPLLDAVEEHLERHHGEPVEEVLQLLGDERRQEVLAEGEDLPELDVGGPEELEAAAELDLQREVAEVLPHEGADEERGDLDEEQREAAHPRELLAVA